jgi:polysaccharide biosynthesis/export protein
MRVTMLFLLFMLLISPDASGRTNEEYQIGVDDVLDISLLQPDRMTLSVTVTPDGSITFPYIGKVVVKEKTPSAIQEEIQNRLAEGYLKYPVVAVAVQQCRSRKFYVYGEVIKPGTFYLEDNMTVLKAISSAGGFTKFGSPNRVRILRVKKGAEGYENFKVDMDSIMNGSTKDVAIEPGDIVRVKEGVF